MKLKTLPLMVVAVAGAAVLAGCSSPAQFESAPVRVETSQGVVTCQLYTPEMVVWDRSINRPNKMDVRTADNICINEGRRLAAARKG